MDTLAQSPPKCTLANLANIETFECQFNPTQLVERVGVNWNRLDVPGLSHQVLQYKSTSNRQLPSVEFYLDRFAARAAGDQDDLLDFRRFLLAFTVPTRNAAGVASAAPPRMQFIWPGVLGMTCVVTGIEFTYTQFASDASVSVYTARVELEEIRDVRVTSEQLRKDG